MMVSVRMVKPGQPSEVGPVVVMTDVQAAELVKEGRAQYIEQKPFQIPVTPAKLQIVR